MGGRGRLKRVHVDSFSPHVGYCSICMEFCSCYGDCYRRRVSRSSLFMGYSGATWDTATFMWSISGTMGAATGTGWAVQVLCGLSQPICGLLELLCRLLQILVELSQAPCGMFQVPCRLSKARHRLMWPLCMLHRRCTGWHTLHVDCRVLYAVC